MAGDHAEPQGITEANASSSPIESSEESLKPAISADDPMDEAKTGNFWVSVLTTHQFLPGVDSMLMSHTENPIVWN